MIIKYKGYNICIVKMAYPQNPRNYSSVVTTMYDTHNLGDDHPYTTIEDIANYVTNSPNLIWLPFYYTDGIITKKSYTYGQQPIGYIFTDTKTLAATHGWETITKRRFQLIYNELATQIAEYASFMQGDVYSYIIHNTNAETFRVSNHHYIPVDKVLELAKMNVDEILDGT